MFSTRAELRGWIYIPHPSLYAWYRRPFSNRYLHVRFDFSSRHDQGRGQIILVYRSRERLGRVFSVFFVSHRLAPAYIYIRGGIKNPRSSLITRAVRVRVLFIAVSRIILNDCLCPSVPVFFFFFSWLAGNIPDQGQLIFRCSTRTPCSLVFFVSGGGGFLSFVTLRARVWVWRVEYIEVGSQRRCGVAVAVPPLDRLRIYMEIWAPANRVLDLRSYWLSDITIYLPKPTL